MSKNLLPCPFCGGEAEPIQELPMQHRAYIICSDHNCWGHMKVEWGTMDDKDKFIKRLIDNWNRRAELEQYKRALCEVCTDLACDDQCPYQMPDFEPCPECEECPGNLGEIHQNTDRDLKCWERYFLARAKAGDQDG